MDILLQTIVLEFSNLVWFGGHLGFFTKISPFLQLNSYKTANNGRILDFKVSIEAYGHSASIYRFRIFKFGLVAILDFVKLSISQPFEELQG